MCVYFPWACLLLSRSEGFKGLVDPEVLGGDEGRSVAEQLRASAFGDVRVIKFSVPVMVLPALEGGDGADHESDLAKHVWEGCALGTPLEVRAATYSVDPLPRWW